MFHCNGAFLANPEFSPSPSIIFQEKRYSYDIRHYNLRR